jgi:hypothetical protein
LHHYGFDSAYVGYMKNIGFKFETIKSEIHKNNPLILSVLKDGNDYYKNHSITIIGYELYRINGQLIPMLVIYDNWYSSISYVDYNKMSTIASIHYAGPTFKQKLSSWWNNLKTLK